MFFVFSGEVSLHLKSINRTTGEAVCSVFVSLSLSVCVCVLRGHQNVFEVEDCAGDKGQISRGTSNFNSLDRYRSESSPSPSPPTPNSLSLSLMHKYKQVLDEDCRVSSKCTCYAKTAGPLMRANYFRKQQLSCLKMCDVFGARVCA